MSRAARFEHAPGRYRDDSIRVVPAGVAPQGNGATPEPYSLERQRARAPLWVLAISSGTAYGVLLEGHLGDASRYALPCYERWVPTGSFGCVGPPQDALTTVEGHFRLVANRTTGTNWMARREATGGVWAVEVAP